MAYKNKKDQAIAAKRHYEANKQKIIDRSKKKNIENRKRNKDYRRKLLGLFSNSK